MVWQPNPKQNEKIISFKFKEILTSSKKPIVGVFDTLSDLIQYLNFTKKLFIQYLIQYCFTQDSIQNIIQFKKDSADSIQKIIQFNSQGIIELVEWEMCAKIAQKV